MPDRHPPRPGCYAVNYDSAALPKIQLINTPEYRENYANSVQVRVNLWDFFLMFGRVNQTAPDNVAIHNFQGVYVSPQQAKALLNVLQQNVTQYETAFGEIKLEPQAEAASSSRPACPCESSQVFEHQNILWCWSVGARSRRAQPAALKLRDPLANSSRNAALFGDSRMHEPRNPAIN